ncbi:YybH family protein [Kribbella sp. NPDC050124]|uniref:YybH family protein n=1 Tax=Kribbella sp. NPDC050124 TaxID=3364114 RepID=UPI00379AAE4D
MSTEQAVDEVDIRERIDALVDAVRAKDLAAVRTMFAPNLVSFDIEPPLRHLGAGAKLQNWTKVFTVYAELDYEVRDLTVLVNGDLAVAYAVNRLSGTLQSGDRTGYWVRWTACFRKLDGAWLIAHDQISVPTDFATGRSVLDLEP